MKQQLTKGGEECPSDLQLRQLISDELDEYSRVVVETHVDSCTSCQAVVAELCEFPEAMPWRELLQEQEPLDTSEVEFLNRLKAQLPRASRIEFPGPPTDEAPLGQLEEFEIKAELGEGGMGVAFLARDSNLNNLVALKVLKPELATSSAERERFSREGQAAAAVKNDHVVAVLRAGVSPNFPLPFLVLEFIDGGSLKDKLADQRILPWEEVAVIARQTAIGLSAAHEKGCVHRDVKPSNILLDVNRERAKITDFGLARVADAEQLTQAGSILGTPAYMSPEHIIAPENVDARSDVYSLGIVLYEMLTGVRPFEGTTHMICKQTIQDDPQPPRKRNEGIPRDLETICLKCLRKSPANRYSSASDLADDLQRFLQGEPILARPVSSWERLVKRVHRNPRTAALISGIAALSLLAAFGAVAWPINVANTRAMTASRTTSDVSVHAAKQQISVRDWGEAASFIDEALKATPNRAEAYLLRGRIRDETGELDSAEADYDRAIMLAPTDARTYFHRGTFYSRHKRFDEADGDFAKALELDRKYVLAYVNWANLARDVKRTDDAVAMYDKALDLDPKSARAYSGRAVFHHEQGSVEKALADFNKGLEFAPLDPELLANRAKLLTDLGRLEEARQNLDLAIRADPEFAIAYNSRGHVLLLLGRSADAISDYTAAIDLEPQFALAYCNRGHAHQQAGRPKEALDDYNQAVTIDPQLPNAYANRAGPLRQLGRFEDALADCNRSLKLQESAVAYMNRGNVYSSLGKPEEAFADYENALQLDEQSADTYLNRGVLYYNLKQLREAISDYTIAISLNPRLILAYVNRGNALKDLGQLDDALSDYNKALGLAPEAHNAYFNRGVLFLDERRFVEAVSDFDEAIELAPTIARYYKARADAFDKVSKDQLALQDYNKAVELDPRFVDAYINRAELLVDIDIERSLSDIQESLRLAPDSATVLMNIGAILDRSSNYAEAEKYLTEAIRLDGQSALAFANRALTRQHLKKYEEALEDFEMSLALEIDPETLMNRAGLYFEQQNFREAINDYSKSLAVAPASFAPLLYTQRAAAYAQIGEFATAVEDCEKALAMNPNAAQALIVRGSARTNLDEPLRALEDFSMALQIGGPPQMLAMLYHNRGFLLHRMGDNRGALDDFNRALTLNPDSVQALNARADINVEQGACEDALADIDKAVGMSPHIANLHNTRGRVLRHLRRFDEATEAYSEAIRLNPTNATAYGNRGELYQELKHDARALADYNECLRLEPEAAGFLLNRANLHLDKRRFDAALADAEAALAADKGVALRYYAVKAKIHVAQGEFAEAIEAFTQNLLLQPAQSRCYLYRAEAEVKLDQIDLALRDAKTAQWRGLEDADGRYRLSRLLAQLSVKLKDRDDEVHEAVAKDAIQMLSIAIDGGFSNLDEVQNDEAWTSLRLQADFVKVADRLRNEDPQPPRGDDR